MQKTGLDQRGEWTLATVASALLMLVTASVVGCVVDDADELVSARADPLAAWNFTMWDRSGNSYPIDVCFVKGTADGGAPRGAGDWEDDKDIAEDVLTQSWEAHSAVDLQFAASDCSSPPSDWMPIELRYDSNIPNAFGGEGHPGKENRSPECTDCQVLLGYGANRYEFETGVVHEVGHALGLRHERTRPDCTTCYCVGGDACSPIGDPRGCDPDEGGPILTADYDLFSIMAWWECYVNRVHDGTAWWYLSHGDKVGIGILYPPLLYRYYTGSIGARNGFYTSDGMLVRGDGLIVTDWTAAGAHTDVYDYYPYWYAWVEDHWQYVGQALELAASSLPENQAGVFFVYDDTWSRQNAGLDDVIVDSSLHTAIAMSTQAVLALD